MIATDAVRELCRNLGVRLITPRKESRAKFIVRNGKLCRFPLKLAEALDMLGHAALKRDTSERQDLDSWARAHLGDSAADYLLTPFVRGIYGVQPNELGVSTAFPFLKLPAGQTLLGAMFRKRFQRFGKKSKKVRAAPRAGMGDLVGRLEQRLEQRLGLRFRRGERINELPDAANIILATPADRRRTASAISCPATCGAAFEDPLHSDSFNHDLR